MSTPTALGARGIALACALVLGSTVGFSAGELPEGVRALSEARAEKIATLTRAAETYRGLALKEAVPSGQMNREELAGTVVDIYTEEMPPAVLTPYERVLAAFGFIEEDLDLATYMPELLTSQIAGFYEPDEEYLVLVESTDQGLPEGLAEITEDTTLVHELVHAIQDQHFDLGRFALDETLSDAAVARLALIEGDATVAMYGYMMGAPFETLPNGAAGLELMLRNPEQIGAMFPGLGAEDLIEAPPYFRDSLMFSYLRGAIFCVAVRRTGGQKLLDHAFREDPPRSTEQILHPEKWFGARDDPIAITLPRRIIPRHRELARGTMGEYEMRLLLRQHLPEWDHEALAEAVSGWGGDRYALLEKGGEEILVWMTVWDTTAARDRFRAAIAEALPDWQLEDRDTRGLLLVNRALRDRDRKRLARRLRKARTVPGPNRSIDLAGLGISEADKPAMLSMQELLKLLDNPTMRALMGMGEPASGEEDMLAELDDLLRDPAAREALESLIAENTGQEIDVEALLSNPMVRDLMAKMISAREVEPGRVDGRAYINEELGFSIRLPEGPGWYEETERPDVMQGPQVLFVFRERESGTNLLGMILPMPLPGEIGAIAPMLEMGIEQQVAGYVKESEGLLDTEPPFYEIRFKGRQEGEDLRFIYRITRMGDGKVLMLVTTASATHWPPQEVAVVEALDSYRLLEE